MFMIFRFLFLLSLSLLLCSCTAEDPEVITIPGGDERIAHGKYLVHSLAACGFCHGDKSEPFSPLSGGRKVYDVYGEVNAPNITPSKAGIGEWTSQDLIAVLRQSIHKDGTEFSPTAHKGYQWLSDRDVFAIIAYLNTQVPVGKEVEDRDIGMFQRNTVGMLHSAIGVEGYVPPIAEGTPAYGRYLVEHAARCGYCHDSAAGLFSTPAPLGGGVVVKVADGEKIAPGIRGKSARGLIDWTPEDLIHYLKTGETADEEQIDPAFCPVDFYARASDKDLEAIADYIMGLE